MFWKMRSQIGVKNNGGSELKSNGVPSGKGKSVVKSANGRIDRWVGKAYRVGCGRKIKKSARQINANC